MKALLMLGGSGPGVLALALAAGPVAAQSLDSATLVIRAGAREVGSETFRIVSDSPGIRVTARAAYGARPATEFTASFDRGKDGGFAFQLDRRVGSEGVQVYAVQKGGRITIRRVERGAEQASELPGRAGTVLLADSVFSLLYQLVPLAGGTGPVSVLFPLGTRRLSLTLERVTAGAGTVVRFHGGLDGEVELGDHGQVVRIQLRSLGLEAVRKPD